MEMLIGFTEKLDSCVLVDGFSGCFIVLRVGLVKYNLDAFILLQSHVVRDIRAPKPFLKTYNSMKN